MPPHASMGIGLFLYVLLILVGAPWLAWRLAASGILRLTPRPAVYRSGMATSWMLALVGAAILWLEQGPPPAAVGLTLLPATHLLGWSLATLAALLAGLGCFGLLQKAMGRDESPDLLHLIPRTRHERWLFAGVSLSAGLTEEFMYRGVALGALAAQPWVSAHGGAWLAAAVVAVSFGLGHGYQDAVGMCRAAALGLVLATPVILTGSLLPGMAAHTALDLTALARRPRAHRPAAATASEGEAP